MDQLIILNQVFGKWAFHPGIMITGVLSRLTLTDNNQNQQLKLILTAQQKEKHTKLNDRLFVKIPVIKTYNPRL